MSIPMSGIQVRQVGSDAQVLIVQGGTVTPSSVEFHVLL